jgi:hypothetical protein
MKRFIGSPPQQVVVAAALMRLYPGAWLRATRMTVFAWFLRITLTLVPLYGH